MCRTALEFPPHGKRCGRGDHFSEEDREVRRVARNIRQRELYRLKKNNTAGIAETVVDAFGVKRNLLETVSKTPERLASGIFGDHLCSREEERTCLATLLAGEQSGLAYREIIGEDEAFRETINSTHEVYRVKMGDDTFAYFKDYDQGVKTSGLLGVDATPSMYGHSALGASLNEVAAYRLSQALGEGFDQLVPETVFTEYNGMLGTLQQEAVGRVQGPWSTWNWDEEQMRRAAIFDVIAASQDRHDGNYIVNVDDPNSPKPTLIDNGFAFPHADYPPIGTEGIVDRGVGMKLTDSDRVSLTALLDSPDMGGVAELLSERSTEQVRKRIEKLLSDGVIDNVSSGDFYR